MRFCRFVAGEGNSVVVLPHGQAPAVVVPQSLVRFPGHPAPPEHLFGGDIVTGEGAWLRRACPPGDLGSPDPLEATEKCTPTAGPTRSSGIEPVTSSV